MYISASGILKCIFWMCFVAGPALFVIFMKISNIPLNDKTNTDSLCFSVYSGIAAGIGISGLYFYPWILLNKPISERLKIATMNWISLSVFEELVFQIPHNALLSLIYEYQGPYSEYIKYVFFAYGLADSRWNDFNPENYFGLPWGVWTKNLLEGAGGFAILVTFLYQKFANQKTTSDVIKSLPFLLVVLFRDAMLFRQNFSYLTDQHMENYIYSLSHEFGYRNESIAVLYLINAIWSIAPVTTAIWVFSTIEERITTMKNKQDQHNFQVVNKQNLFTPLKPVCSEHEK